MPGLGLSGHRVTVLVATLILVSRACVRMTLRHVYRKCLCDLVCVCVWPCASVSGCGWDLPPCACECAFKIVFE